MAEQFAFFFYLYQQKFGAQSMKSSHFRFLRVLVLLLHTIFRLVFQHTRLSASACFARATNEESFECYAVVADNEKRLEEQLHVSETELRCRQLSMMARVYACVRACVCVATRACVCCHSRVRIASAVLA